MCRGSLKNLHVICFDVAFLLDISLSPSFQLHNLLFSRGALCFHKIASSLFLNVPAPLSHYSCLLVCFFSRCLTFPWAPFSPFSLIASVPPTSPFLSYPGVYLCTRSFYFSYGFKYLPFLSPPSVPFFVFVFLFPRGPSTLLSSLLSVCFHTSCFYLNLTSR